MRAMGHARVRAVTNVIEIFIRWAKEAQSHGAHEEARVLFCLVLMITGQSLLKEPEQP